MSIPSKLGDTLYLNLQLWDGTVSLPKRVFVELRDDAGVLIEPLFEIAHVGGGEFRNSTRVMPSDDMITASYFVYENDGVTIDSAYGAGKDVYMRDYSGEIIATNLDGKVSSVSGADLEGEISTEVLTAEIPVEITIEAEIKPEEILEAIIEEEVIL